MKVEDIPWWFEIVLSAFDCELVLKRGQGKGFEGFERRLERKVIGVDENIILSPRHYSIKFSKNHFCASSIRDCVKPRPVKKEIQSIMVVVLNTF